MNPTRHSSRTVLLFLSGIAVGVFSFLILNASQTPTTTPSPSPAPGPERTHSNKSGSIRGEIVGFDGENVILLKTDDGEMLRGVMEGVTGYFSRPYDASAGKAYERGDVVIGDRVELWTMHDNVFDIMYIITITKLQ